jgi:hypothetical protein
MLSLPCPRLVLVAVGITNAGATPQISFPGAIQDNWTPSLLVPVALYAAIPNMSCASMFSAATGRSYPNMLTTLSAAVKTADRS